MEALTMIGLGLQTAMLAVLIVLAARFMTRIAFSPLVAFFVIGMVSFLLSDLYWMAFTLLESDARMPFAVNEIGECACILLLATAMRSQLSNEQNYSLKDILLPSLFTLCNVALWVAWSGEWAQDILSGLALGYYLVIALRLLKREAGFSYPEGLVLRAAAVLIVILQALTFVVEVPGQRILEAVCTGLMAFSILLFFIKSIIALRRNCSASLSLSFGGFGWILICLYMSAGLPYLIVAFCVTLIFPLMYLAVKGRVMAA